MEEPLEQEHSMNNDDLKPSSSSTTTTATNNKSSRSTKQTATNGTTRRHKRRRKTNSARSSSDHSSSSSRSSSSSSRSSHSSMKNLPSNEQESKKSRSCLAQEQLQLIIDKTKTGKYDILDGFAFLSFETDEDWRISFEHFRQQQQAFTNKKSYSLLSKKNGNLSEHLDGHSLHRSISVPCKIEDGHRISNMPSSAPVDDTSTDSHRSSMWQNLSPNKISADRQSTTTTTIKSEPTNRSSRTASEHDENQFDIEHIPNSILSSRQSTDDIKSESQEKKHRHHHHHHHHHKRHKIKHDLSVNGDSNKHPTITSMSDLAKQHIKNESMSLSASFNFPPHFDPKLFPLPTYPPFGHPSAPSPFPGSFDPSLMLASRLYGGPYSRDLPMPPPPRPSSRSLQHPFSLKENHPESMEKMLEKFYPGVLPTYLAVAAAAASTSSNSPVSSLNVKMHGASPNGPDNSVWSHREALQRQFLAQSNKPSSTKSPLFDPSNKLPSNHSGPSPNDHHHHRRQSSSTSMNDMPNSTTPTGHPLYLAPVIVTEFHQHQHNHNHTHEHKLNISTKDDRQSSPRSKTPLSSETKKPKSSFSVTDMFIDKPTSLSKHSPSQPSQQGFLSVVNNKKEIHSSSLIPSKKSFNGKWSTAHVHIAWMIYHHEQRLRDKGNQLNSTNKIRSSTNFLPPAPPLPPPPPPPSSSSQSTFLPPPLPLLDGNNDLSLLRPPMPSPFSFPFDMNSSSSNPFRPSSTTKLPRPMVTSMSSSSSTIKTPTIKREQKTPFIDDRHRRMSPSPLSRPTSGTNIPPSSPSHRIRMDYPSLLLPPPPQHQLSPFSLNDDRKRFMTANTDLLPHFASPAAPPGTSPFLSSLFPMNAPPIPPPPPLISTSRRSGLHSDSSKSSSSSLFPPPPSTSFDFTRSPFLPHGIPAPPHPSLSLSNNQFESDRYRFLFEQQAREREFQLAMMTAATSGNAPPPPPPLFTDPNSSALFKHF